MKHAQDLTSTNQDTDREWIRAAIVSKNGLFAQAMKHIFGNTAVKVCLCADSIASAQRLAKRKGYVLDLIFAEMPEDAEDLKVQLGTIEVGPKQQKYLMLESFFSYDRLVAAFAAGVHGMLSSSIQRPALLSAIDLVMQDQPVFPSSLVGALAAARQDRETTNRSSILSVRETEVVDLVARGLPNKIVAFELGLSESTVKVHLKSVQQKLNLDNRIQVAVWAHQSGSQANSREV